MPKGVPPRRKHKGGALAAVTSQDGPLADGSGLVRSEQATHCEFLDSLPMVLETAEVQGHRKDF